MSIQLNPCNPCCGPEVKKPTHDCLLFIYTYVGCNIGRKINEMVTATVEVSMPGTDFVTQTKTTTGLGNGVPFIIPLKYADKKAHVKMTAPGYTTDEYDTYPCSADNICTLVKGCNGVIFDPDDVTVEWSQTNGPELDVKTDREVFGSFCVKDVKFIDDVYATITQVPDPYLAPTEPVHWVLTQEGFIQENDPFLPPTMKEGWTCLPPTCCPGGSNLPKHISDIATPDTLLYNDGFSTVTLTRRDSFIDYLNKNGTPQTWQGCALRKSTAGFPSPGTNVPIPFADVYVPVFFEVYCHSVSRQWAVDTWGLSARQYDKDGNYMNCNLFPMIGICSDFKSFSGPNGCNIQKFQTNYLTLISCQPALVASGIISRNTSLLYGKGVTYTGTLIQ